MVVDVAFKLLILEFIVNTDKPDEFISPTTFNVDKHDTGLFKIVVPDTFNEEVILTLLLFINIAVVPLATKFKLPNPLEDIVNDLFGNEGSYAGNNAPP
jgi:hypothetical protein